MRKDTKEKIVKNTKSQENCTTQVMHCIVQSIRSMLIVVRKRLRTNVMDSSTVRTSKRYIIQNSIDSLTLLKRN